MFRSPALRLVCLVIGLLGPARVALAQDASKAACAQAYEQAQERRASGKLRGAREALVVCANAACPSFVQSDCAGWLTEVEREMPSIVIAAKAPNGDDTVAVRVLSGDVVLATSLDGTAIEIDPGMHEFKFEMEGAKTIEKHMLVRQGQKNRFVEVEFESDAATQALDSSPYAEKEDEKPAAADPEPEAASGEPGPLRPYAYVAGGVGGLLLGGFAILGIVGKNEYSDLEDSCGRTRTCTEDQRSSVGTKLVLADVCLFTGIAALGGGVAMYILSMPSGSSPPKDDGASVGFDVAASPVGGAATVYGAF